MMLIQVLWLLKLLQEQLLERLCQKQTQFLLEPMMKVEVVTPEEYMGDIIGDLNSRRGQVSGMEQRGVNHVVNSMVPLANMFGYVNNLRSMSQGRASYTMTLIIMNKFLIMLLKKLRKKFLVN